MSSFRLEDRNALLPVHRIVVPRPPVGAKAHLFLEKGTFVLEEQPGNILHLTCAHAGSGGVKVIDGKVDGARILGRELFRATPMAMGVWHLNAGFQHGLVIEAAGNDSSVNAMFTAVWQTRPNAAIVGLGEKQSERITVDHGTQVLTTKDCVLYAALITNQGSGRFTIKNGRGEELFVMPSAFTGSFLFEHVFAKDGLQVEVDFSVPPNLALSWMEVDPSEETADGSDPAAPRADTGTPRADTGTPDASANSDAPGAPAGSAGGSGLAPGPADPGGAEGRGSGRGDSGPVPPRPPSGVRGKRR